jgi:Leucine-rich repeat (LRR) protein
VELREVMCLLQVIGTHPYVTVEQILEMGRGLYLLDLTDCDIIDIEEGTFNSLTDLNSLKLSKNSIRKIDNKIFSSPHLQVLYLDGNGLEMIEADAFAQLPKLQKLYLQYNELETMSFTLPSSLNDLDISHNHISSITTDLNKVRFRPFHFSSNHFKCLFNLMYWYGLWSSDM